MIVSNPAPEIFFGKNCVTKRSYMLRCVVHRGCMTNASTWSPVAADGVGVQATSVASSWPACQIFEAGTGANLKPKNHCSVAVQAARTIQPLAAMRLLQPLAVRCARDAVTHMHVCTALNAHNDL